MELLSADSYIIALKEHMFNVLYFGFICSVIQLFSVIFIILYLIYFHKQFNHSNISFSTAFTIYLYTKNIGFFPM